MSSSFDDRKRQEEAKYQHDEELRFKIRNRRNKLFGIWLAETHLGRSGDDAFAYAKEMVMAAFERPPGRWIAEVKDQLREMVIDGDLAPGDKDRAMEIARELVKNQQ
jgi:hypothetical protein